MEAVVRPEDILNDPQQSGNLLRWGRERGSTNNIFFSLSPHSNFLVFSFLIALTFTLIWASTFTWKNKLSFCLLMVAPFFDLVGEIEVYFWVKSINGLFLSSSWRSSPRSVSGITGMWVGWEKEEERWTAGRQSLWNGWHCFFGGHS